MPAVPIDSEINSRATKPSAEKSTFYRKDGVRFADVPSRKKLIERIGEKQFKAKVKSIKEIYKLKLRKIERARIVAVELRKFIRQSWLGSIRQIIWRFLLPETAGEI